MSEQRLVIRLAGELDALERQNTHLHNIIALMADQLALSHPEREVLHRLLAAIDDILAGPGLAGGPHKPPENIGSIPPPLL